MAGELRRGTALRGVIGGHTEGTITSGGFSYDQSTLEELIKEWLSLADDYSRSFHNSQRLILVDGPGLDIASKSVAGAANSYGRSYLEYLRQNSSYCVNQAQLCQNALDDYLGVERRNVRDIDQSGQSESVGSEQEI